MTQEASESDDIDLRFKWTFLKPKNLPLWIVITLAAVFSYLPVRLRYGISRAISLPLLRKKSGDLIRFNMQRCFGKDFDEKMVEEHLHHSASRLAEAFIVQWIGKRRHRNSVTFVNGALITETLAKGQGALIFCHHNPDPTYSHILHLKLGPLVLAPKFRRMDPLFIWYILGSAARKGVEYLARTTPFKQIAALKEGKQLVIFADFDQGLNREGVYAPFFGVPARTITLPYQMAKRAKAKVFFSRVECDNGRYTVTVEPFDEYLQAPDKIAAATLMNQRYEDAIRKNPKGWVWNNYRFRSQADGSNPYLKLRAKDGKQ